jgi:hypothetical protein
MDRDQADRSENSTGQKMYDEGDATDLKEETIRKASIAIMLASAIMVVLPNAARADAPQRGSFDNGYERSTDPDYCAAQGIVLHVRQHEYGTYSFKVGDDGTFLGGRAQFHYDAWISANGITLRERDVWNNALRPDGSVVTRGVPVHIRGPGGIVQRDAGRVVFDPNGNPVTIDGPHPQLEGQTFCTALAA